MWSLILPTYIKTHSRMHKTSKIKILLNALSNNKLCGERSLVNHLGKCILETWNKTHCRWEAYRMCVCSNTTLSIGLIEYVKKKPKM